MSRYTYIYTLKNREGGQDFVCVINPLKCIHFLPPPFSSPKINDLKTSNKYFCIIQKKKKKKNAKK